MNEDTLRDLMRRLGELERTSVRYRGGSVTDDSPLTVTLGGAATAYANVQAVTPRALTGDHVATLTWGNDLLVLGAVADTLPDPLAYIGASGQPTFTNSWVNYDTGLTTPTAGARDAAYHLHGGRCYLTGVIKSGTVGQSAFTLPVTPAGITSSAILFAVRTAGGTGAIDVGYDGTVVPSVGSNVYFALDGVSFRHA